ncbi:MAG: hypothetical protein ACREBU_11080, partial [Nitrososphaera sp.]
ALDLPARVALELGEKDFWSRELSVHRTNAQALLGAALTHYRRGGFSGLLRQTIRFVKQQLSN